MHRRQLDKIKADEKRLEEEEVRRIAVSEKLLTFAQFKNDVVCRKSKNRCLTRCMAFEFTPGSWC